MYGNLLEDEKLLRTVHLAIGADYDGLADAFIHLDCLIKDPSMRVDGKQVMKDGDLLD
jgi:leucyl aminopeptidase (aminopeptidase T)